MILNTHSVLKLQGSLWAHHTWVKTLRETTWGNKPLDYSHEPLSDLKFLSFKKQHKGDPGYSTTTLSLTIRAHLCLQAKDLGTVIFRKKNLRYKPWWMPMWHVTIILLLICGPYILNISWHPLSPKGGHPGIQMVRGEAWSQSNRRKGSWGEALFIHPGLWWHLKLAGSNYWRWEEE